MKLINILSISALSVLALAACNPIEDGSLRAKYVTNAGTPITTEELDKAISITQPFPNQENVAAGDQVIVFKNSRPDIGGAFHFGWSVGEKILASDCDTLVYDANGTYTAYYEGISAGKVVKSTPVTYTVTNILDPWAAMLTGAKDKADANASRNWGFRTDLSLVCDMAGHGWWKYTSAGYTPETFKGITWWNGITYADAGDQRMVFKLGGYAMTKYKADGTVAGTGSFSFLHEVPETGVMGWFITSIPVIGYEYNDDDASHSGEKRYYILRLDDKHMTLYKSTNVPGSDWDTEGWRVVYEVRK